MTEEGKTSAETHLAPANEETGDSAADFFDSPKLCWALNNSQVFSQVKCSEKLGIAKVNLDGKTIVVSKAGRINVRRAENEEDALKATQLVSRATWPAMICARCGGTLLECVAGLCGRCRGTGCPLLLNGPPDPTSSLKASKSKTISEILSEIEVAQQQVYDEAKSHLNEAFENLKVAMASLCDRSFKGMEQAVQEKLEAGKLLGQRLVAQGQRQIDASAGLFLMAVAVGLENLSNSILELAGLVRSQSDSRSVKQAWDIVTQGYGALWQRESNRAQMLTRSFSRLKRQLGRSREKCRGNDLRENVLKMAELGLRLSQVVSMRLAV